MKFFKVMAITASIALLLQFTALLSGLRWNGSGSFPLGVYITNGKTPSKGDLVIVKIPDSSLFKMATERGYLNVAYSTSRTILKRIVGVSGDKITIDIEGVEVNGCRLVNSKPRDSDGMGRPMTTYLLKDFDLGTDDILLMSEYSPDSFDSRYFGPLPFSTIESVVVPLWTWG